MAELIGFPRGRVNAPSVAIPKSNTKAVKTRERRPKKYTDPRRHGINP
jgi:hypothetical protein